MQGEIESTASGLGEALQQPQTGVDSTTPQAAEPQAAPKSLREELQDQFKTLSERPRDEHGRFTKPGGDSGGAAAAPLAEPDTAGQPAEQPATAAPKHQAPTSWAAEAKAEFDKLPAHVQAAVAKRELEVHQGFTRLDEDRNLGKQVKEAATPYMAVIQAEGGNAVSAFKTYLNHAYMLRNSSPDQKLSLVKQLCSEYNIPVEGLLQASPSATPATGLPQQQFQGLDRDGIAAIVREEQRQASLQSEVNAFAVDTANTHFQQVRPRMGQLLTSGQATSLKDAYDKACAEDPYVRSSLEAERLKAEQDKRQAELTQKSVAARRAGGSVNGGPGASTPTSAVPNRSLRDELAANLRAAQGAI